MLLSFLLSFAFAGGKAISENGCLGFEKTFAIADDNSKFKTISFIRADSSTSGLIQIDAGQPGRAMTLHCDSLRPDEKKTNWSAPKTSSQKSGIMSVLHPLMAMDEAAHPTAVFTNADEGSIVQSKVTIKRGSYADLTDVNWGDGVSLRVYCGFGEEKPERIAKLEIYKNGKLVNSFDSSSKEQESSVPKLNCTSKKYEISLKDGAVTQTSAGLPTPRTSPPAPAFGGTH